ncbi:MAG: GMC family oxidoreductase [Geminicoccaceae bacterium]|nr:GMC family oxidoreductase [Geminicoccaceae bacterium]
MAERRHADVLVIGAGATGAIASLVLGEAGLDVVCLEQGGWVQPDDHPHYSPDWEWQRQQRWNANINARHGDGDYPVETNSSNVLMWNAIGGSTNVYGAIWPRYRPSDFKKGVEHGLAPDWPITYEDVAPYYERADRLVGVSGLEGNPAMPPHGPYPTPQLPLRRSSRRLIEAFDRLGWHWWPLPAGVISEDYDGRPACNGCNNCSAGCARGSMSKFSLSVWPKALAAGVELRPYAQVERIEKGRDGLATGAVYVDRMTGQRHEQTADVVVLAGNGVGSPWLLLASDNLANGSDQVGRNLLHHTLTSVDIWVDEQVDTHMGYVGSLLGMEFAETDTSRGFVNGFNFNCATGGHAGWQSLGILSQRAAPWGADHHRWFRERFDRGIGVFAIGDDLPSPTNRITLSDTARDDLGRPAPALFYEPGENDRRMMRFQLERLEEIARACNAVDYQLNDYCDEKGVYRTPAWHLLGTCRMGADPEHSVVNGVNQSWDVPNLYIVDGSTFATGGVVNPTPTVCALALRAAENLRDQFRERRKATKASVA